MNKPILDLDALQARIDSAANYGFVYVILESDILAALIDRLRKAEAAREWISVDERLPNKYEEVLVWPNPTDYCNTAQLYGDKWKYVEYSSWGVERVGCQVTHWMPLPAAPDSTPTDSADSEGAKG